AVCENSSRVEKSVPKFALLTMFLRNLCSAAAAAVPPFLCFVPLSPSLTLPKVATMLVDPAGLSSLLPLP
ncbi:hypothetical protein HN51_035473, partial [Arachis hypogaea]